jgi:hypothetical protein
MFTVMSNIKSYTLDRGPLPPKLRPIVLPAENIDALPVFNVGTLKYKSAGSINFTELDGKTTKIATDSDWASVGGCWDAFDPFFQRRCNMRIQEYHGIKIEPDITKLNKETGGLFYHLLHMAGRKPVTFDNTELASFKGFFQRGGFLLVEDCGTNAQNREFFNSVAKQLMVLYPDAAPTPITIDHSVLAGKFPRSLGQIREAAFSRTVRLLEPDRKQPELFIMTINKRPAVFLSKLDLSSAVTGSVYWDRVGYSQNTARAILANLCMYIRAVKSKEI